MQTSNTDSGFDPNSIPRLLRVIIKTCCHDKLRVLHKRYNKHCLGNGFVYACSINHLKCAKILVPYAATKHWDLAMKHNSSKQMDRFIYKHYSKNEIRSYSKLYQALMTLEKII